MIIGRLPGQAEEGADRDSAALVQGAIQDPAAVRSGEAQGAGVYGVGGSAEQPHTQELVTHPVGRQLQAGP